MSRILLGHSYFLHFDPKLETAMQPYPPLGTLYAAAYLRSRGHEVGLFDAMLSAESEWDAALELHRPAWAVLYEDHFNYLSKMCLLRTRQAALRMISTAKRSGCMVALCGADATDRPEIYLEHGADCVILGEGELTLGHLLDSAPAGWRELPENIPGLAWRDSSGAVRQNPPRERIADIDTLPPPAWDLVDIPRYRDRWMSRHGYFSMNVATTRGCPYPCNWCAKPIWGRRYSSHSPEYVVCELLRLKRLYHPLHIWFVDDIFGLHPGWIEQFERLAIEKGAVIPFKCQMRADLIQPAVVASLAAAGCRTVWLGAESGSQKILDAMEKGMKVEQIYRARRLLAEAGIQVALFLQFGYPGEQRADIELTLRMVRDLAPDDIGISISYPLPGTPFYDRVSSQMGPKRNWVDSDDLAMLYHGPFPEWFYLALYRAVHAEFRMRKAVKSLAGCGWPAPGGKSGGRLRALASIPRHWLVWQSQRRRLTRLRGDVQTAESGRTR